MRKVFLSLMSIAALASQAVTPNQVFKTYAFEIIPTFVAFNDQPTFYFESEESTSETTVYRLYTESFEEKGSVTFNQNVIKLLHYDTTNYFDNSSLYLTQTLFNDDEDYEALIEAYDESTGNIIGVNVVKGNTGEVVTTFEFPSDFTTDNIRAFLYTTLNGEYVCISDNSHLSHLLVYDISTNEDFDSVKSPVLTNAIKIRPAIVNQGEEISVEAIDNTEIESITVTDMNGSSRRVAANSDKTGASINSGQLAKGMHIVGVETANGTQSSKVIVK